MRLDVFLLYSAICLVLSFAWAKKKRIDVGWGFFFSFFFSPLIGALVISMSPSKKNLLTIKNGVYGLDKTIGIILVFGVISAIHFILKIDKEFFLNEEQKNDKMLYYFGMVIACAGGAFYFFNRFKRHEKIYNELTNPNKSKDIEDKD